MTEWFKPKVEQFIPIAALGALTLFLAVTGLRKDPNEKSVSRKDNLLNAKTHAELKDKVIARTEENYFNLETISKWFGGGGGQKKTAPKPIVKPVASDEIFEARYGKIDFAVPPSSPIDPDLTPGEPWFYQIDYSKTYDNRPYSSQTIAITPDDYVFQYDGNTRRSTQADYNFGGYFENPGDKSKEHLPWEFKDRKDKRYP
jgi:hypothetical protein